MTCTSTRRQTIGPGSSDHLRYRFVKCVRASVASSVARDVWARSLDDTFTDHVTWLAAGSPKGYVWGVRWQMLYPGLALLPPTPETREWAAQLDTEGSQSRMFGWLAVLP